MGIEGRRIIGAEGKKAEDIVRLPLGSSYELLEEIGPDYKRTGVKGIIYESIKIYIGDRVIETLVTVHQITGEKGSERFVPKLHHSRPVLRLDQELKGPSPQYQPLVPGVRP